MASPRYIPPPSREPAQTPTARPHVRPTQESDEAGPSRHDPRTYSPSQPSSSNRPPYPTPRPIASPAAPRPPPAARRSTISAGRGRRGYVPSPLSALPRRPSPNPVAGPSRRVEPDLAPDIPLLSYLHSPTGPGPALSTGPLLRSPVDRQRRYTFPRHVHQPAPALAPAAAPRRAIPPLPADRSTASIPGFQADYIRPSSADIVRPTISDTPGQAGGPVLPLPPVEAFLSLRIRNAPRGGWPAIAREEGWDWTVRLSVLQHPAVGQSMEDRDMAEDTPRLHPALVVQIQFLQNGQVVPTNHPQAEKRLAYMTLHLSLLGLDSDDPRDLVRYPGDTDFSSDSSPNSSFTSTESSLSPGGLLSLVGPTFGVAKRARLAAGDGWSFVFPDLRVRPAGDFRLEAKLINILGPGPMGASTGITPIAATVITRPFSNL